MLMSGEGIMPFIKNLFNKANDLSLKTYRRSRSKHRDGLKLITDDLRLSSYDSATLPADRCRRSCGSAVLTLVLTMLILAVMGIVLISQLGTSVNTTVGEQGASQAFSLSEGGLEMALRFLIDNPNWPENGISPNTSSFSDTSFGSGSFTASSVYPMTALANSALGLMTPTSVVANVNDTSVFPSSGHLMIDLEFLTYTGKTATSFTGVGRAGAGTTATAHYQRTPVFPATTLASAIGSSDTTIVVGSTTGFLSSGTLRIDQELMDYAGVTGSTFTGVTRGAHGTTAASHSSGVPVWPGLSQCELTTTGIVGVLGEIGFGRRFLRLTVVPMISSTLSGLISTVAGDGTACPGTGNLCGDGGQATSAQLDSNEGVEVDRQGNFLYIADTGEHRIRRVNLATGVITNFAGIGTACPGTGNLCGDTGLATAARLDSPQDIALNPQGTVLYIADTNENRIRQVNLATGIISAFAGTGSACTNALMPCGDGGLATAARLNSPRGIAVDSLGNVYIADTVRDRIRRVVISTGVIEHVAGSTSGVTGDIPAGAGSSTTTAARFRDPQGVAVSNNDQLIYIADTINNKIRLINLSAGTVTTVAGQSTGGFLGDGGPATSCRVQSPEALMVDYQGNVYIADTGNNRIRKIITGTDGVVNAGAGENIYTIAGNGSTVFNGDNQDPLTATLNSPRGIALHYPYGFGVVSSSAMPFGLIQDYYIGDTTHDRVRHVTKVENLEEVDWREEFQ